MTELETRRFLLGTYHVKGKWERDERNARLPITTRLLPRLKIARQSS